MKYTLFVTRQCNLRCDYCYIGKDTSAMPLDVARRIVDFAYARTPPGENIDFAFFGGEPLLEFDRVRDITALIEEHARHDAARVQLTLVSNGTVFGDDIADYVQEHNVAFGISCDGPPAVHDQFRRYRSGKGSSARVEATIREALDAFSQLMVNAVYRPETFDALADTVDYFSGLGVRQIYLSPDYSAPWTKEQRERLVGTYRSVGQRYMDFYRAGDPRFISLIDSKIAVLLRGGYQSGERCSMGRGELAFTPDGGIYPCERLVGDGGATHRIGHIDGGIEPQRMLCHHAPKVGEAPASPCADCGVKPYCMNWCGCSNYFASGYYDRASALLCASERAAIQCAADVYRTLDAELGDVFFDHASGSPLMNSV